MAFPQENPSKLFSPLPIGPYTLSNRIVMAPLTRFRASDTHVPLLPIVAQHYAQRACVPGTLLISEASVISPSAGGVPHAPGIWNAEQIQAWKHVVQAVHKKGGVIFCQLWALGRAASAEVKKAEGTGDVMSASAVPMSEGAPAPRALEEEEIQGYIKAYASAARNAVEGAGFDGVEIHAANGYLVDQFTQDVSNTRTDAWGGSVAKRARFALEVTRAVVEAVGPERTALRLSPWSTFQGMRMQDPVPQFMYLLEHLKEMGRLAYLHLVESRIAGNADVERTEKITSFVEAWGQHSPVLVAGGFTPDSARRLVEEEMKERDVAVVFGRYFISTPDLVFRVAKGIPLSPYDREDFYRPMVAEGYVDYPFSEEWVREKGAFQL
ncbi:hypothetical protein B0A50_01029 [Salinomyces thailandicus]|uniref:NADH:flavin oxidoreductase/NADH oxidase N-terminal domain-containing protein n=1 Tax=Salinomyces thailandicus TaxID=706561 RepID=A0A4U0UC19_9PEZI|nr:hypothetical protein B0A50_01029 [Salinomyces thailandica]